MNTESEWIEKYFHRPSSAEVLVGIGDDGAVLRNKAPLVVCSDSIAAGVHFFEGSAAAAVGHKALAVNLSDMAAMGAAPRWALLALSMPHRDEAWLADFARGFLSLAATYHVDLIGGDLLRAPLSVTVTLLGEVSEGGPVCRNQARCGDGIYVTGNVGDAGLAWQKPALAGQLDRSSRQQCRRRLLQPTPRVQEGLAMAPYASAAIDVSDGLLLDLQRLLEASRCGARLEIERIPLGPVCARLYADRPLEALSGGEDYELLITVPADNEAAMRAQWPPQAAPLSRIGAISAAGLDCSFRHHSLAIPKDLPGFEHFAPS